MNTVANQKNRKLINRAEFRARILSLQQALAELPNSFDAQYSEENLVTTYFAQGIYARKMLIPAGTCVVGKIHFHAHLNIIVSGKCRVVTEDGSEELTGLHIWTSSPGTKRAVVAITDVQWITIHENPNNLTDVAELEKEIIAPDYDTYDKIALQLGENI